MSNEPPRPSLWRSVFAELDQDAPSQAGDHASHPGYLQARTDLATSAWKITGEGDAARARIFIAQGVEKLEDPHYRFSLRELFLDLPPEALPALERLDDAQGNSYLSLPHVHYARSVEPLIRMHDPGFLGSFWHNDIIDVTPGYESLDEQKAVWEDAHSGPPELRETYYKGRNELVAGEWKATAQGNRIRTIKGGARHMKDPAYKLGIEHAILGIGRIADDASELRPDQYKIVTLDDDITVTVPEHYYQAHISPFLLRPGDYRLQDDDTIDLRGFLAASGPQQATPAAISDGTVSTSLLTRRVKHDVLSARETDWTRDDTNPDATRFTLTLTIRANRDAYTETAKRFLEQHYTPSSDTQDPFMDITQDGTQVTISLSADRYAAVQRDAPAYQQQKGHGR